MKPLTIEIGKEKFEVKRWLTYQTKSGKVTKVILELEPSSKRGRS